MTKHLRRPAFHSIKAPLILCLNASSISSNPDDALLAFKITKSLSGLRPVAVSAEGSDGVVGSESLKGSEEGQRGEMAFRRSMSMPGEGPSSGKRGRKDVWEKIMGESDALSGS